MEALALSAWWRLRDRLVRYDHGQRSIRFIGACGVLTSLLLVPPVFGRLFALDLLEGSEAQGLWIGAAIIGGSSILLLLAARKSLSGVSVLFLVILVVVNAELCSRLVVVTTADQAFIDDLIGTAYEVNTRTATVTRHPFLSFIGNPDAAPWLARRLGGSKGDWRYNNFGFADDDFRYAKPDNTIRVACVGGSTTESGYPTILERILSERFGDSATRLEVLNFGIAGWTTAHSLVNFSLNVVDFEPDYVVFHHAWNDSPMHHRGWNEHFGWNVKCDLRGDYLGLIADHASADPLDSLLTRTSVLYQLIKRMLWPLRAWIYTEPIPERLCHSCGESFEDRTLKGDGSCEDADPLWPYTRNVHSLIALAETHGTVVVLTTQPRALPDHGTSYPDPNDVADEVERLDGLSMAL